MAHESPNVFHVLQTTRIPIVLCQYEKYEEAQEKKAIAFHRFVRR